MIQVVEVLDQVGIAGKGNALVQPKRYLWNQSQTSRQKTQKRNYNDDLDSASQEGRRVDLADERLQCTLSVLVVIQLFLWHARRVGFADGETRDAIGA